MIPTKVTSDAIFIKPPFLAADMMRNSMNATWSQKEKMWKLPKNIHVMRELLTKFPELKGNPSFVNEGVKLKNIRDHYLQIKAKQDTEGDVRLRPYQKVDVEYLKKVPCAGIFNEPRTGKTPTSIVLIKELQARNNLIITPASLLYNWDKEFQIWYPEMEVFIVNGSPKKREIIIREFLHCEEPSTLIVSKDTWKRIYNEFEQFEFDTVFVDEAHFLRKRDSQQSKAVVAVNAKRRYALTGTPTVKNTEEIFGILQFLYPNKFTSYWNFFNRYFEKPEEFFSVGRPEPRIKPHRQQELEELIGFISVQRKRKDVMNWLPDKTYIDFYVEMDTKQRKLYDAMVNDFMVEDEESGEIVDTSGVLAQLTRMRQICLDPALLSLSANSAKTKALLEWLDDNREPVVIMSMFTSYLKKLKDELEKLGYVVGEINGQMSNQQKFDAAQQFQSGKMDIILCNIISAGTGFTLDRAETIIFMDKAWNPSENEQAQDRITPVSQERNHKHTIISFVCKDSYDETFNGLLKKKKSLTDIINEGGIKAIKRLLKGETIG